jgi:phosphonate transport system substrate-binding protein
MAGIGVLMGLILASRFFWRVNRAWLIVVVGGALLGCERSAESNALLYSQHPSSSQVILYRFAVHPLHNPHKLSVAYQPLMEYLNTQPNALPNVRFELEASRDYQQFEQKVLQKEPAFILPNPWQTLRAMESGYRVIAMAGEASDFKGVFIVRRDAEIKVPLDLKGKTVSYPSKTALAAAIMPQYFLHQAGLNVQSDLNNVYVGSQESSILNVYLGHAVAGATWPPPWRSFQKNHPEQAAQLKVMWETSSLMNNSVMAHSAVPLTIQTYVAETLLSLATHADGPAILAGMETAGFFRANNEDYDKVRDYVAQFEKDVRPVTEP